MSHDFSDVTLQSKRHAVILHGLQEVTLEREVILHDLSVTSIVLMVQNGRNIYLFMYSKTIVDLYFGRIEVL